MDNKFANDEAYCDYARYINELKSGNAIKTTKPEKKEVKQTIYWELANGKKIDIDKMSIEHLKNVLKFIVAKELLKPKT